MTASFLGNLDVSIESEVFHHPICVSDLEYSMLLEIYFLIFQKACSRLCWGLRLIGEMLSNDCRQEICVVYLWHHEEGGLIWTVTHMRSPRRII